MKLYERYKKNGKWTWRPHDPGPPQPTFRSIWFGLSPENNQRWKITCGLCFEEVNRSRAVMGHTIPGNGSQHTGRPRSIKVMTYDDAVICTSCWEDKLYTIWEEEE